MRYPSRSHSRRADFADARLALKSVRGSALLQGVAALALTVLIAASMLHTATLSMRTQLTVKVNGEIEDTFKQLELYLGHNATCLEALGGGQQLAASEDFRIYDPMINGRLFLVSGKSFKGWKVDRILLSIPRDSQVFIEELNETRAQAVLTVELAKSAGGVLGSTAVVRQFPLAVALRNNRIRDCSSLSTAPSTVGLPTREGWSRYDPALADAQGCQDLLYEGVCPPGQRALTCLGCVGVGCTPKITLYDSATTPDSGAGTAPWPTWTARHRVRYSMAMLPSTPGGAHNKCVLTVTYCYNDDSKLLHTYAAHSSNTFYQRVAPLCVED